MRYQSSVVKAETARDMAGALDHEFARVSDELGCHADERVVAIVQSRDAYRKATEAAEQVEPEANTTAAFAFRCSTARAWTKRCVGRWRMRSRMHA